MTSYTRRNHPNGPYLELDAGQRPQVSTVFNARAALAGQMTAAVAPMLGVTPRDIMFAGSSGGFGATGGHLMLMIANAAMPDDPQPLANAVGAVIRTQFPQGCACEIRFLPKSPAL